MSNSSLINYTILSPNYGTRTVPISKLTPHHVAGVGMDSQAIARLFTSPSRDASCNYAIGVNGDITLVVPEEFCPWTSGTWDQPDHGNDGMAVTFEIANDGGAPDWHVSDASIEALINLCVDICKRNNIPRINFTGDANGNLTQHNYFQATACPGPYLKSKFPYIAEEINRRLNSESTDLAPVDIWYTAFTNEWLGVITNYNEIDYNGYAGMMGDLMNGLRGNMSMGNLHYRLHFTNGGWSDWAENMNGNAGICGEHIDQVQMYVSGLNERYRINYRLHILGSNKWTEWCSNKEICGISGHTTDAIQIYISIDPPPVVEEPKVEEPELYRVRKSWEDAKSQVGAFRNKESAIKIAQENECNVYNSKGEIVYEYAAAPTPAPVEPEPTPVEPAPAPLKAYELDYPEKHLIVDESIARTEEDCVKAIKRIKSTNNKFDENIAKAFFLLAPKYKIDPMMAISQSIIETGWFKYNGSAVSPAQHNYCGLGVTSNGVTGATFENVEDGVTAQLQHLYAYGCKEELDEEILDPRFKYVTRGIAPYWEQLAGRWAVPGYSTSSYETAEDAMKANATYGQRISAVCKDVESTEVTEEDINKYFFKEVPPIVEPEPIPQPEPEPEPKKDSIWIRLLKAILKAIIDVFKGEGNDGE